jgi:hypothetical protein
MNGNTNYGEGTISNIGNNNTSIGQAVLANNSSANNNTGLGAYTLYNTTNGINNVAIGTNSMLNNESGSNNVAIGAASLMNNLTNEIVSIGANSLQNNTTGENNTAIGTKALYNNNIGTNNIAIGSSTLLSNINGNENISIGPNSLYNNISGSSNIAIGLNSLSKTNSNNNIGIGEGSLKENTTGYRNICIGYQAGNVITTGYNNVILGYQSQPFGGFNATNEVVLGNNSTNKLYCSVTSISSLSDERDKTNIMPLNIGLEYINKIQPISFTWDTRDGAKKDINEIGFIAQDLLNVQKELGITIPNLVEETNPNKLLASYGVLLPILVKSIQDLKKEIDNLKININNK